MTVLLLLLTATAGPAADPAAVPLPAPTGPQLIVIYDAAPPSPVCRLRERFAQGHWSVLPPRPVPPPVASRIYETYVQWAQMPYTCELGLCDWRTRCTAGDSHPTAPTEPAK